MKIALKLEFSSGKVNIMRTVCDRNEKKTDASSEWEDERKQNQINR